MIITNSRYALVGYFITSYPTRAHGIIINYFPRCFSFFQKFLHFTYMLLWFRLIIPSFPAQIDDMRSRFSALSESTRSHRPKPGEPWVCQRSLTQPRSQGLSSLPPQVVGRKTLVAAGHMTTQNLGGKKICWLGGVAEYFVWLM